MGKSHLVQPGSKLFMLKIFTSLPFTPTPVIYRMSLAGCLFKYQVVWQLPALCFNFTGEYRYCISDYLLYTLQERHHATIDNIFFFLKILSFTLHATYPRYVHLRIFLQLYFLNIGYICKMVYALRS